MSLSKKLQTELNAILNVNVLNVWAEINNITDHDEVKKKKTILENEKKTDIATITGDLSFVKKDTRDYTVSIRNSKRFKKGLATETIYDIIFNKSLRNLKFFELYEKVSNMFDDLIATIETEKNNLARVFIEHEDLYAPIIVGPYPVKELSSSIIMKEISSVMQSADSIRLDERLTVNIGVMNLYPAGGRLTAAHFTLLNKKNVFKKRSLLKIDGSDNDNLCVAKAIIVADTYIKKDSSIEAKKFYRRFRSVDFLKWHATLLQEKVGLNKEDAVTLNDICLFEKNIKKRIIIYSQLHNNKVIYTGIKDKYKETIYLYLTNMRKNKLAHYDVIVNIKGFLGLPYYCNSCDKGYANRQQHTCKVCCTVCYSSDCTQGNGILCPYCNALCRSKDCYVRHLARNNHSKSLCEKFIYCLSCGYRLTKNNFSSHICYMRTCTHCEKKILPNHKCYIRALHNIKIYDKFVFYDFECIVNDNGIHTPNFVVAQTRCSLCMDAEDVNHKCEVCGTRCDNCNEWLTSSKTFKNEKPCLEKKCCKTEVVFSGKKTLSMFLKWLLHPSHTSFTAIAHNNAGYDLHFILKELRKKQLLTSRTQMIFRGSKLLYLKLTLLNMRFLDSYNFLAMSLDKIPKAMGFKGDVKGFFPYVFNTWDREKYIGSWPAKKYYDIKHMSNEKKELFDKWYSTKKLCIYDHQQELLLYCQNDVNILRKGCLTFRNGILQDTGLDPFAFVTMSGVCLADFRLRFLTEHFLLRLKNSTNWISATYLNKTFTQDSDNSIINKKDIAEAKFQSSPVAIIPNVRESYSKSSICWLYWKEELYKKLGKQVSIQHALNGGEKKIIHSHGTYKVDGYAIIDKKPTIFCFNGCVWHGCPLCFPLENIKHKKKDKWINFKARYQQWLEKKQSFKI